MNHSKYLEARSDEKSNKTALNANDDKIIQSIDSMEAYVYETSKDLVCKKEESKCNNTIKQFKNG